jgi:NitT/TauT family transport system ATP-binding protein
VLNHIALRVREGEFVSLIGPSGCGKSTILRLILGSQFPTAGRVEVDERPVRQVERDRGIVYQAYSLFPHLSVLDNIAVGPVLERTALPHRLLHTPGYFRVRRTARAEARILLDKIGLSADDQGKYPHELSGGMRQRVAIAQAMIMRPKVLLMDEPFGALDHNTREEMQLLALEKWKEYGMTVIFVTHDLEEALYLGTRVIGLSQHWRDEKGQGGEGAMVVVDKEIAGGHPKPTKWKYSRQFSELLESLRSKVLDPDHRQHVEEFDLTHRDAVHVDDWHPTEDEKPAAS